MHSLHYSLTKAAAILDVHRNTLAGWIERGAPVVSEANRGAGKEWQISIPKIIEWRIERAVDDAVAGFKTDDDKMSKDEADRRKAVAQAGLAEVDLEERRRTLMLVADAESILADFCQALKSGVDNGIVKTAGRAAVMSDPNEIREFFSREWNRSMKNAQQLLNEKWAEARVEKTVLDGQDEGNEVGNDDFED